MCPGGQVVAATSEPGRVVTASALGIPLVEDVCESHGATHGGKKAGTFGLASNFSFYFAHHMSTVEGGMVCTNDDAFYDAIRMFRSHGMVREAESPELRARYAAENPELSPDFIFAFPAFNVRSTEINAVLGRSQLKRLDDLRFGCVGGQETHYRHAVHL